ncbi:ankyrin repeat-containing domain protein [Butyriboletus roseoflavus]|nr:ankyrin repeat-containing domain protein [Butyriboletus roseoflavus]
MEYTPSPALFEAAAYLSSVPPPARVSNTTKLEVEQLYGLYKYLTVASVPPSPRPSLFDLTSRAKWDAWSNTGKKYAGHGSDAERRYLDVAQELGWAPGFGVASKSQEGEVWDEDLGVSISLSSTECRGGMGGSVSAMGARGHDTGSQVLHAFAIQGDTNKITRYLVEHSSVDVNKRDEYGYTALHLACDRGNLPVVKVLIKHGADATTKDPDDLTGMELAQIAGHDDICDFLQTELH